MLVRILYLLTRDTYKLFLLFWQEEMKTRPEHLRLAMITRESVLCFLDWLENNRGCCISTKETSAWLRLILLYGMYN